MIFVYKDRIIQIEWSIFRGTSQVPEDFSRALVKLFLVGNYEKYAVPVTAEGGTLVAQMPQDLPDGAYSLEAIWVKNYNNLFPVRGTDTPSVGAKNIRYPGTCHNAYGMLHPWDHRSNDRCLMRSRKEYVFAVTSYQGEETAVNEDGSVTIRISSAVATYGYDGLSAYELAVMRGDFNGSEGEWILSLRSPIRMSVVSQNEYNNLKDAEKLHKYTFYVIPDSKGEKVSKMYIGKLEFPLCTSGNTPEPDVYILYGNILDNITSFSQITLEMLESSTNHIIKMKPQSLPKTSLGILEAGSKVIVLIPNGYNYVATKDNGIGEKVQFDESIMGSNGHSIVLGNQTYKMYGEFMTIRGELFIYID